jgi:mycothiol synthase
VDSPIAARTIDAAVRERVRARAATVHRGTGVAPLGEATWRDLEAPGPESFVVLDDDVVLHAMRNRARWTLGVIPGGPIGPAIGATLAAIDARGGGAVTLWVNGADRPDRAADVGAILDAGLVRTRCLLRLEVDLPIEPRPSPPGVAIGAFDAEADTAAWLSVNNRAFVEHPEQGGWDEETFGSRRAEAWFRPEDLRIARLDGRVVASCWTKRTDDPGRPPIGEIYVVGVDPGAQGIGLGPAIVAEGLDHLARRCGAAIGMLYVDATNAAAVALYDRLGFRTVREDHAFEVVR